MGAKLQQEGFNAYRIWDRAYRLEHSAQQQRCDTFSLAGAAIGAAAMQHPALRMAPRLTAALAGASIGVSDGVLWHVISNPKEDVETAVSKGVQAVEKNVQQVAGAEPHPQLPKKGPAPVRDANPLE